MISRFLLACENRNLIQIQDGVCFLDENMSQCNAKRERKWDVWAIMER
jgi:hypothetical protein